MDSDERAKLINDCYNQLKEGGWMVFVAILKQLILMARAGLSVGQGRLISADRYEVFKGVEMFFYNPESVNAAFGKAGLIDITEVEENYPFFLIKCRK